MKNKAFTLAETLITMAIIGVVAAVTIPVIMQNIQARAWSEQKTNFEMKITEAMNQMKTGEVLTGYTTTQDFVVEFMKYMKISNTCLSGYYTNCFVPTLKAADGKEVDTVAKLRTGKDFGKSTYTSPLVGVQFINGIQGLIAYDPDCAYVDPYNNTASATECLSILYDLNGSSKPNQAGKDIQLYHVDKLGLTCAIEADGGCFGAPFIPTPLTYEECGTRMGELELSTCCNSTNCLSNGDFYAGAAAACGSVNKLPSVSQTAAIAQKLYPTATWSTTNGSIYTNGAPRDNAIASSMGFSTSGSFVLWNSNQINSSVAWSRLYGAYTTGSYNSYRYGNTIFAICSLD